MLIKKVRCKILFRNNNTFTFSRLLLCFQVARYIAWENRRHLISQRHHWFLRQIDVCKMCAELPYWYYRNLGSASDWLMQISHAAWPIRSTAQIFISMEFLWSFCRRHFPGKPVVVSQNVGCFLRLLGICIQWAKQEIEQKWNFSWLYFPFVSSENTCGLCSQKLGKSWPPASSVTALFE